MSKLITLFEKKPIESDSNLVGYLNDFFTSDNHEKIITYYNSCNHLPILKQSKNRDKIDRGNYQFFIFGGFFV